MIVSEIKLVFVILVVFTLHTTYAQDFKSDKIDNIEFGEQLINFEKLVEKKDTLGDLFSISTENELLLYYHRNPTYKHESTLFWLIRFNDYLIEYIKFSEDEIYETHNSFEPQSILPDDSRFQIFKEYLKEMDRQFHKQELIYTDKKKLKKGLVSTSEFIFTIQIENKPLVGLISKNKYEFKDSDQNYPTTKIDKLVKHIMLYFD